ncbi:MAG: TIGR03621 family F420-dependent LLM class oxidoreductase [Halioglobus sp.]|nr:TIGR03621 family F420-dependent LLM class oxidoreductase [Halioglobus sp.]
MSHTTKPFRFGVNVPQIDVVRELSDAAREAEDLGYEVFSCPDHLNFPNTPLEPMAALAWAGAVTATIELQPLVLANDFRYPALLAKQAATLDLLSGGRFALGLGAGWFGPDFQATDIPFHRPGVRIARLEEAIDIIRGLHRGEPFDYQGNHFTIAGMTGTPRPVREPIPLMIGASGPKMLGLATRRADTVALTLGLPIGMAKPDSPKPYAEITDRKVQWLRDAAGDQLPALEIQTTVFGGGITGGDTGPLLAPLGDMLRVPVSEFDDCPHVLAGPLEHCVETVKCWRERWGISYVTLPGQMMREMAPLVAALRGR